MSDELIAQTREAAEAQIKDLMGNRDWQGALINGDAAKQAEWTRLHDLAYGTEPAFTGEDGVMSFGGESTSADLPALPGNTPIRDGGVLEPGDPGFDEANAELFAGPDAPHRYVDAITPIYGGKEPTDQDLNDQIGIQASLHAEGVPTFVVSTAVNVMAQALKNGLPDEAAIQSSIASCTRELERRHGAGAQQILADARKVFERLDKRDSRIGDILSNTGVINNPQLIETLARLQRDVYSKKG